MLQPDEFRLLMKSTGFDLSDEAIDKMLVDGDVNGDGVIDQAEFLPIMLSVMRQVLSPAPSSRHNPHFPSRVRIRHSTRTTSQRNRWSSTAGSSSRSPM